MLVVDDEEIVRKTAATAFNALDSACCVAANGAEALDVLRGGAGISLVILDLTMPVMTGEQALPLIREMCPESRSFSRAVSTKPRFRAASPRRVWRAFCRSPTPSRQSPPKSLRLLRTPVRNRALTAESARPHRYWSTVYQSQPRRRLRSRHIRSRHMRSRQRRPSYDSPRTDPDHPRSVAAYELPPENPYPCRPRLPFE